MSTKTKESETSKVSWRDDVAPVKNINPNGTNRTIKKDDQLKELSESIREVGLLNPITVIEKAKDKFSIVAGERRFEACKMAKLAEIPIRVLNGLDEEKLKAVQIAENVQRVDLTPLEEGDAVARLLDSGKTTKQVASIMGKTVKWVRVRSTIRSLTTKWRNLYMKKDSPIKHWTAEFFEVIARLPASEQDEFFDEEFGDCFGHPTFTDPKDIIEATMRDKRDLRTAKWKLDDETLHPKAGPCTTCPLRSNANPDLFGDVDKKKTEGVCLDSECWKTKTENWLDVKIKSLLKSNDYVVGVVPYIVTEERKSLEKRFKIHTFATYDLSKCKKGTKNAVPAIVLSDSHSGKTGDVYHVVDPRIDVKSSKETKDKASKATGDSVEAVAENKKDKYDARRRSAFVDKMKEEFGEIDNYLNNFYGIGMDPQKPIEPKILDELFSKSTKPDIMARRLIGILHHLLGQSGWKTYSNGTGRLEDPESAIKDMQSNGMSNERYVKAIRLLVAFCYSTVRDRMIRRQGSATIEHFEEAVMWAKLHGYDVAQMKKDIAAEIPYAKSWKSDVEDEWEKGK